MQRRRASAVWKGDLKSGTGALSSTSGVLEATPYSYRTRFENEQGTNPEELIGAAHAGCFSMALSGILAERGLTAEEIRTEATVTLEEVDGKPTVSKVHLSVQGRVPGVDEAGFREAAEAAKAGCPVSRVLNAEISMEASLQG
jgi:lipoyl-dependent peroxiredoxin